MKFNKFFGTLIFSLLFFTTISAKTWRVNNVSNTDADFTNLNDAHDAARDGDTLLIEGSATSYGNLDIYKRLVLIGPGYYLSDNPNATYSLSARIGRIRLYPSTSNEPSSGAAGTQIMGLESDYNAYRGDVSIYVNDVIIRYCSLSRISITGASDRTKPATGVQVFQCHLSSIREATSYSGAITDIQIYNNIIGSVNLERFSSGLLYHNTIEFLSVPDFQGEIRSNIITTDVALSVPSLPNANISHNTTSQEQLGDTNENNAYIPLLLFVGQDNNSEDGQWQLFPDAPVRGTAHDGTDRGAFGGSMPYSLSGQGGIPTITFLEMQPIGTQDQTLSIRIKAISGN